MPWSQGTHLTWIFHEERKKFKVYFVRNLFIHYVVRVLLGKRFWKPILNCPHPVAITSCVLNDQFSDQNILLR
jgi:hypothetical protein